ncbi:flippase [Verrucomicrobia bacterium S94]|nr:flippase [Verrucomicrobia bacterium S94]
MRLINSIFKILKLSGNREKVVRNVYWAVSGKVVQIASGLLVGILVARYLGPEQFGLMNYVISYVMLFSILATFGLDGIEVRELSKHEADKGALLGTAFGLRLLFASIALVLILTTLILFESDRYTFTMVMVYSVSLIFSSLNVIRNYFTSIILNEYVVKSEIARTVLGALIKVVLLWAHCSLTWFIAASAFDIVLVAGGYVLSYRKKAPDSMAWRFDRATAGMLIRASFPLLLSGAAIVVYQKINAIMIRNMLDNAALGQFSAAAKLTEFSTFIPMMIAQTITPILVKVHEADSTRYLIKRQQFMDLIVWSGIGMAVAMSLLAYPAILVLYGREYASAIPVLQITAWRSIFMALAAASGQLIIIEGLQNWVILRNLMGCVVSIGLNWWLIPVWGIHGSAIAMVLSVACAGFFSHHVIRPYRFLVPIQWRAIFTGWRSIASAVRKRAVD